MTNYLAFDIEIAAVIPDGETDWADHRPLGISCAAIMADHWTEPEIWAGVPRMPVAMVAAFVERILFYSGPSGGNYRLVGWNSLGFDLDILAEESMMYDEAAHLARRHVDPMFQIFCLQGYPLGLDKAARGMGLAGKTEGMDGAKAPALWAEGGYREVMDYLAQDVRTTLELVHAMEDAECVQWTSNRGRAMYLELPDGLLTVDQCLALPLPDTSWMTDPWPREKFTGWMGLESS